MPLTLQRDALASKHYPFRDELLDDVSRDVIAFLIAHTPDRLEPSELLKLPLHRGFDSKSISSADWLHHWFATPEGLCPATSWNIAQCELKTILILVKFEYDNEVFIPPFRSQHDGFMTTIVPSNVRKRAYLKHWLSRRCKDSALLAGFDLVGCRLLTSGQFMEYQLARQEFRGKVKEGIRNEWNGNAWATYVAGTCGETLLDLERLPSLPKKDYEWDAPAVFEVYVENRKHLRPDRFGEIWQETIRHPVIPFDRKQREHVVDDALRVLDRYIAVHKKTPDTQLRRAPHYVAR